MVDNNKIDCLKHIIDQSQRIVFFGGAGVSTESGIPDFRSPDGLYAQKYSYPPETIVSHDFFFEHPEEFYKFYREKMLRLDARPNAAHIFLAKLERAGKLTAVVTQNIDDLHAEAGSKKVYRLHGTVCDNHCTRCGSYFPADYIIKSEGVPRCDRCGGIIKPDVVLYGEGLDEKVLSGAISAISAADALIIGGTSLAVYPAAGLIDFFRGRYLVVINKTPISADGRADLVINGNIGEVFAAVMD